MIVGMGLVASHTYNLSHAYLSHTPHCKAPYISGLVEGNRVVASRLKTRCNGQLQSTATLMISLLVAQG